MIISCAPCDPYWCLLTPHSLAACFCIKGTHHHNENLPELGVMQGCDMYSPGQQATEGPDGCEACPAGTNS